jgi:hypothetical protein
VQLRFGPACVGAPSYCFVSWLWVISERRGKGPLFLFGEKAGNFFLLSQQFTLKKHVSNVYSFACSVLRASQLLIPGVKPLICALPFFFFKPTSVYFCSPQFKALSLERARKMSRQVCALLLLALLAAFGDAQATLPTGSGLRVVLASGNNPTAWRSPPTGCWANVTLAGAGGGTYTIAPSGDGGAGAMFNILMWLPPSSSFFARTSAAGVGSLQGGPAAAVYFAASSGGGIIAVAGGGGAGAKGPAFGGSAGPPGGIGLAGSVTPGASPLLGGRGGSQSAPGAAGVGTSTCGTTPNTPPKSGVGSAGGDGAMCGSSTGSRASGGWAPGGASYSSNHLSAGGGGGGGWFGGGGGAASNSALSYLGGGGGGE